MPTDPASLRVTPLAVVLRTAVTTAFALLLACFVMPSSLQAQVLRFEDGRVSVVEGAGSVEICTLRQGRTDVVSAVELSTRDVSATSDFAAGGVDYQPLSGAFVQFRNGESRICIPLLVFDDPTVEGDEVFVVSLGNPLGGELGFPASLEVTILDDESIDGVDLQIRGVASPFEWKDAQTISYTFDVSNVGTETVTDALIRLSFSNAQSARVPSCADINERWQNPNTSGSPGSPWHHFIYTTVIDELRPGQSLQLLFCTAVQRGFLDAVRWDHGSEHDQTLGMDYELHVAGDKDVNPGNNGGNIVIPFQQRACLTDPQGPGCCISYFLYCLFHPSDDDCAPSSSGLWQTLSGALKHQPLVSLASQTARFLANASSLGRLYQVRDRLADLPGGRQAVDLYYRHDDEVTGLLVNDSALRDLAIDGLDSWSEIIDAFADRRDGATIEVGQVQSLVAFLDALSAQASSELRAAIELERQRLDIDTLAGLTIAGANTRLRRLSCRPDDTTLCLGGGRYRVEARWADFDGEPGKAHAVPLTDDTGSFWFFDSDNVELVIKVLDGRAINGRVWVYYGALSNVEYAIDVVDTETGEHRLYVNPAGRFASVGDTDALSGGASIVIEEPRAFRGSGSALTEAAGVSSGCLADRTTLCLNDGRFEVEVSWRDFDGGRGQGFARPLTSDSGTFWFFGPDNIELIVKVLDGRAINDHFWVYYGALSNVEFTLRVTDTMTGVTRVYHNPLDRFESNGDPEAFQAGRGA